VSQFDAVALLPFGAWKNLVMVQRYAHLSPSRCLSNIKTAQGSESLLTFDPGGAHVALDSGPGPEVEARQKPDPCKGGLGAREGAEATGSATPGSFRGAGIPAVAGRVMRTGVHVSYGPIKTGGSAMRKILVILAVVLALLVTLHDGARAQSPALEVGGGTRSFTVSGDFVYSVKFLCGTIGGPGLPLAAGTYLTAINIHNLNTAATGVTVSINGILVFDALIGPTSVLRLDCRNIVPGSFFPSAFAPSDKFSDGFVTLHFSKEPRVNVVPVYTVTVPVPAG
jgi:hypothetical protein